MAKTASGIRGGGTGRGASSKYPALTRALSGSTTGRAALQTAHVVGSGVAASRFTWRHAHTHEPAIIAVVSPAVFYASLVREGIGFGVAHGATDSLPLAAGSVGAGLAARYYASSDHARRNRAMRRIGESFVGWGLQNPSGTPPRMRNWERTPAGERVDMAVPENMAAKTFESLAVVARDAFQGDVRFENIPRPKFGVASLVSKVRQRERKPDKNDKVRGASAAPMPHGGVRMTIVRKDTLSRQLTSTWPVIVPDPDTGKIRARSFWDPTPVALDEDGKVVLLHWLDTPSLLIAGVTGSGKSVGTHEIVSAGALDPSTEFLLWDGKGELELGDYEPLAGLKGAKHSGIAGPGEAEAVVLIKLACAEMERRLAWLKARGLKKMPFDGSLSPLLMVIEEFTAYTKNAEFIAILMYMLVRIRATGIRFVLTTQRPSAKVMPTDIRDNVTARWAHRMETDDGSNMCLGDHWARLGWSAATISKGKSYAGVGLFLHDGDSPRRVRSWYEGDKMPARVVVRALELRGIKPSSERTTASVRIESKRSDSTKSPSRSGSPAATVADDVQPVMPTDVAPVESSATPSKGIAGSEWRRRNNRRHARPKPHPTPGAVNTSTEQEV